LNPQAISFSMPNVELSNIIYFSFTTLTTLGYGDITPVTWMARNLTILESAIGQIFLTVFIARMVGQELANRSLHVRGPNKDK
jgi:voltage-gated potassium channel Kch